MLDFILWLLIAMLFAFVLYMIFFARTYFVVPARKKIYSWVTLAQHYNASRILDDVFKKGSEDWVGSEIVTNRRLAVRIAASMGYEFVKVGDEL